jgi:hypothetical protein
LPEGEIQEFATLIKGPPRFAARVILTRNEDGDPDETEVRWFDSEKEARAAIESATSSPSV